MEFFYQGPTWSTILSRVLGYKRSMIFFCQGPTWGTLPLTHSRVLGLCVSVFFCYGLILIPWFSRAGINGLSVSVKVWPCKRWINSHIFWTVSVSQSLAVQTLDQLTHFLLWTTDLHLEDTELGKQICTAKFSVMNLWHQGWRCPSEIGRKKSTKSSVMELLPLKQVKVQVQVLDLRHWHHPWRHRHRLLVQLLGLLPVDPDPSLEQLQPAEAQLVLLELRHHCQSSSQLAALQQIGS